MRHEGSARPEGSCWCGAQDWRICFRTATFGLIRCRRCGTFRIDPPPIAGEREAPEFYTDYYASHPAAAAAPRRASGRTSRFWRVVGQVPDLLRAGRRVLDFGCGEGGLCEELRAAGWPSVTGVDVSQSRIARARREHPDVDFDDRGREALRDRRDAYDLIVSDNVVEHLTDPAAVLAELRECLVPSGRIVLITPNLQSGHFRLLGRRWTPELSPQSHVFLFTPDSLRRLVEAAGLRVERVGSFHLPLRYGFAIRDFFRSGSLKDLIWRLAQETGGLWGRILGSGEMVYAVGVRPEAGSAR